MTTLCKRIIDSADKYNAVLNTNTTTISSLSNTNNNNNDNDILQDVNFCRLLGCVNQLKILSLSIVETFDNLTCLVSDINSRAIAANDRIESIASKLNDVDYKVKTTSLYNNSNKAAKDVYNKTIRNPHNVSLLIRNTNSKQIAQLHYNCTAAPKLWLLDNIIGENSDCVSNYSDINFFFSNWLEGELKIQDINKEKRRREKKTAKLLIASQGGDTNDIEDDEIDYWAVNDDVDESIASSGNDDDEIIEDDRNSTKSTEKNKTKFLGGATKVLNIFKRNSMQGGVKEDKSADATADENATVASKDNPDEKPQAVRKNSYFTAYDNIASSGTMRDSTPKKLDTKEEEDIKEKIREIKKYIDLDPQELPTFNVPDIPHNKAKKNKKTAKKSKDKLNKKVANMAITETPQRKVSIKVEDLVRQAGRETLSASDSPPFSPPPFTSDEPAPPGPVKQRNNSITSIIKGPNSIRNGPTPIRDSALSPFPQQRLSQMPSRVPSIAEPTTRRSIGKIFAMASPPPPPPPPPPTGPSKLAIGSLLSDIKKNQSLRRVSIKEKVDTRSLLLNSIKQRSKDVQERNVDTSKFDNLKPTSVAKPTQNEAISAILANRKLIAGSDSDDSDSDNSNFSDN